MVDVRLFSITVCSINLLALYHKYRPLIGYAIRYLFCDRECAVVKEMTAAFRRFRSVCEEALDKVSND